MPTIDPGLLCEEILKRLRSDYRTLYEIQKKRIQQGLLPEGSEYALHAESVLLAVARELTYLRTGVLGSLDDADKIVPFPIHVEQQDS
jgi:hypothetical protein